MSNSASVVVGMILSFTAIVGPGRAFWLGCKNLKYADWSYQ